MYRYFLAIRFLLARPINLLGVIGVMLGVWALIVVVSIFSGYLEEIGKHLQSSTADLTVAGLPPDASYADFAARIEADPNVAATAPRVVWQGLLHPFGDSVGKAPPPTGMSEIGAATPFVAVIGIDPEREHGVTDFAAWIDRIADPALRVADSARPLAPVDGQPALILSRQRSMADGVERGDRAKVTTGRMDEATGNFDFEDLGYRVAGAYETTYAAFDGLNVFVHIDSLREQLGAAQAAPDFINEIAVKLIDATQAEATQRRLSRVLNEDLPPRSPVIRVRTWAQTNDLQLGSIDHQRSLMKLVLFVIMVVAAFLMYATLSMMVTEKTHDIGILTAMGASPTGVMAVFTACGIAISVAGVALGIVTGCASAIFLDDFNSWVSATFGVDLFPVRIYHLRHVPYSLDAGWIAQDSVIALAVGAAVASLPAWRAARHDPLESLRSE